MKNTENLRSGIYKLSFVNGLCPYVGSSVNLDARIKSHCSAAKRGREPREIQKYVDAGNEFHVDILEIVPDNMTVWELRQRELYWIQKTIKENPYDFLNCTNPANEDNSPYIAIKSAQCLIKKHSGDFENCGGPVEQQVKELRKLADWITYYTRKAQKQLITVKEARENGIRKSAQDGQEETCGE